MSCCTALHSVALALICTLAMAAYRRHQKAPEVFPTRTIITMMVKNQNLKEHQGMEMMECPPRNCLCVNVNVWEHLVRPPKLLFNPRTTMNVTRAFATITIKQCIVWSNWRENNAPTKKHFISGLRYMCIEQRKAFEAVIECIDAQAAEVEKECEGVCHVKERLAHWAVQSGILDNFMQGALSSLANGEAFGAQIFGRDSGLGALTGGGLLRNGEGAAVEGAKRAAAAATAEGIKRAAKAAAMARNRADIELVEPKLANLAPISKRITPDFMRAVVQDGCELTRCQLICIRVKFDAKCGGSAGTMLSEAFVRPISQAQEFLSYGSIAPFMGAFLPHQCDFMVKKEVLNEFRIPPELDEALHQKYDSDDEPHGVAAPSADGGVEEAKEPSAVIQEAPAVDPGHENVAQTEKPNEVAKEENGTPNKDSNPPQEESAVPLVVVPGVNNGKQSAENHDDGVDPGDINRVSHVVGRSSPRKGARRRWNNGR